MQTMALSLGAVLTMLSAWFNAAPEAAQTAIQIFGLFLFLDTISGICLAIRLGRLRSKVMRVSLVVKMMQYAMIVGISHGAGLLMKSWFPVTIAFGACALNEAVSIIENMRKLESRGGIDIGPFKPLFTWLGHAFTESDRIDNALEAKLPPKDDDELTRS